LAVFPAALLAVEAPVDQALDATAVRLLPGSPFYDCQEQHRMDVLTIGDGAFSSE
jgi:hypothetical protein